MSLEYIVGYKVDSVSDPEAEDEWDWKLDLEGGVAVAHTGSAEKPGAEVVGTTVGVVEIKPELEKIHFMSGMPAEAVLTLDVIPGTTVVEWPEGQAPPVVDRGDPADDLPDDPSGDRVAEGPESG